MYEGEYLNSIECEYCRNGKGDEYEDNCILYSGEWKNNKREGKGRLNKNNGESIHITWKNDKMEGIGILKKIDGSSKKVFYQEGNFIC